MRCGGLRRERGERDERPLLLASLANTFQTGRPADGSRLPGHRRRCLPNRGRSCTVRWGTVSIAYEASNIPRDIFSAPVKCYVRGGVGAVISCCRQWRHAIHRFRIESVSVLPQITTVAALAPQTLWAPWTTTISEGVESAGVAVPIDLHVVRFMNVLIPAGFRR